LPWRRALLEAALLGALPLWMARTKMTARRGRPGLMQRIAKAWRPLGGVKLGRARRPPRPARRTEEQNYAVDSIVGECEHGGAKLYRVRWAGYGEEKDTWEPLAHLAGARGALAVYHRAMKAAGPGLAVGRRALAPGARVSVQYAAPTGLQSGTVVEALCVPTCPSHRFVCC